MNGGTFEALLILFGDMGVEPVPWQVLHQARERLSVCHSLPRLSVSVLQGTSMTEEQEVLH